MTVAAVLWAALLAPPSPCAQLLLSRASDLATAPVDRALPILDAPDCARDDTAAALRGVLLLEAGRGPDAIAAVAGLKQGPLAAVAAGIRARGLYAKADPDAALAELKRAGAKVPPGPRMLAARLLLERKRDAEAAAIPLELVAAGWRLADPPVLGQVDRPGEVLDLIEGLHVPGSDLALARAWMAAAATRQAGLEDEPLHRAQAHLDAQLALSSDADALVVAGLVAEALGDLATLEKRLAAARAFAPNDAGLLMLHAQALLKLDRAADALAEMEPVLHAPEVPAAAWLIVGRARLALGKPGAADALRRAVDGGAKAARTWYDLGKAEENEGHPDRARAAYEEVVKREPDLVEAHFRLSVLYRRAGDTERAEAAAREHQQALGARIGRQAARERRANAVTAFRSAVRLADEGRPDEASALLKAPGRTLPDVFRDFGEMLIAVRAGRRADARDAALRFVADPPPSPPE